MFTTWLRGFGKVRRRISQQNYLARLDVLEDRTLPSTLTVLNLADSGEGSLRAAVQVAQAIPRLRQWRNLIVSSSA